MDANRKLEFKRRLKNENVASYNDNDITKMDAFWCYRVVFHFRVTQVIIGFSFQHSNVEETLKGNKAAVIWNFSKP